MKYTNKLILGAFLALSILAFTGCDNDRADELITNLTGWAYSTSGGEYTATDTYGNSYTFSREQTEYLASIPVENAEAYVKAKFKSEFPADYVGLDASGVVIKDASTSPETSTVSPAAQALANTPAAVSPGVGTAVSVGLNGLLAVGLALYRGFSRKQITRKDAALDGAGKLIDGIYNVAEVLPNKEDGKRVAKAVDQALELVNGAAGAAQELKDAVKRTETPSLDPQIYN